MFNPSLMTSPRRALQALLLLSSIAALAIVSVACGASRSNGGNDTCETNDDCAADEECRFKDPGDDEGECRSSNTANNSTVNNSTVNNSTVNNSTVNNSTVNNNTPDSYCADICTRYSQCELFPPEDLEGCISLCEEDDTVDASFWSCTLASACQDLPESCEDSGPNNSTPNNSTPNNSTPNTGYRFVMIEDESDDNPNGATPGSDIDAIGVDVDGDQVIDYWASSFEDYNIGGNNNERTDINELLGEPDSDCQVQNFASLGGNTGDNFVIVGFGNGEDVTFGSGAIVQVWELGPTNCPDQSAWKDDETTISVSVSTSRSAFERIGTVGLGTNAVIVP